jgi:hypothetical protein
MNTAKPTTPLTWELQYLSAEAKAEYASLRSRADAVEALEKALRLMQNAWDMPEDTKSQRLARSKAWNASTAALALVAKDRQSQTNKDFSHVAIATEKTN